MRTADNSVTFGFGSLETACETMLLGRLGSEIASIYQDSLQTPLPPRLQELVDRLDEAVCGFNEARGRGHGD